MVRVFIAFVPWILYWSLSGPGLWSAAVIVALAASLGLNVNSWRQRKVKVFDLVTITFFIFHFLSTVVLGSPLFRKYDAVLVSGTLSLMAWGTLLAGWPFTYQYAREDWPPEYWDSPLFRRTNEVITVFWGVVFILNTGQGALSLSWPEAKLWLSAVLPKLGIGASIAFSILFSKWYPRRVLRQQIEAREPYGWPGPIFTSTFADQGDSHDVIVIGAGMGGLTAGALLAHRGLRVLVVEQHSHPGGYCTSWDRVVRREDNQLRYIFDAGVHDVSGLGPRGAVHNLLLQLGIEERLNWRRMTHEYILPGIRLKVPHRVDELVSELGQLFPTERESLMTFFAEMEDVYRELYADIERTGGVPCPPRTVEEMLAYPRTHPHVARWREVPFVNMLNSFFHNPNLKKFQSVLTAYLSERPELLSVGDMAPIFGYYFDGGYYPAGGSQVLPNVLAGVIEGHGGKVRLRTPVRRICVEEGRAIGVELTNGETHRAYAVISNADVRRTFVELVGSQHLPQEFTRRIETLEFSSSAFQVFLGVDFVPEVEPVTICMYDNRRSLGISIPSKVDPALAPPGHSSLVLTTLVLQTEAVTWDRKASGYDSRKRLFGDELIALADEVLPGLREHIVYRQDASPATCARHVWTTAGAIYGPAAGQWRPPSKTPIERLYLAGAGVFPGPGIEAVVISGTLVADAIYKG